MQKQNLGLQIPFCTIADHCASSAGKDGDAVNYHIPAFT
jgi:hypothetical protein